MNRLRMFRLMGLFVLLVMGSSMAKAQYDVVHNIPPYNWTWFTGYHRLYLTTTSSSPVVATVNTSSGALVGTVTVNPGAVTTYVLPYSLNQAVNTTGSVQSGVGLVVSAPAPIAVAFKNTMGAPGGAGNALAVSQGRAMEGQEFRVGYYRNGFGYQVGVLATQNNTVLRRNGAVVATLNAGQSYLFGAGTLAMGDLISADKNISTLIAGRNDAPAGCGDQTLDFGSPVVSAGMEYVVVQANGNSTLEQFTVIATQPNTTVNVTGFGPVTLANAGSFQTYSNGTGAGTFRYVTTNKPVSVYQGTGNSCEAGLNVLASLNCTGSTSILAFKTEATFNVGVIGITGVPVTINNGTTTLTGGTVIGGGKTFYYLSEASFAGFPNITISSTQNISAFYTERVGGFGACAYLSGFSQAPVVSFSSQDQCDGTASLSVSNPTIFSGFQWYLNGVAISGATASSYTATVSGVYAVDAFPVTGGCPTVRSQDNSINLVNGNAGSLTPSPAFLCLSQGSATFSAIHSGLVLPSNYELHYVLVSGGIVRQISSTATFTVTTTGSYQIYAFVAETSNPAAPYYFNIGSVVVGTTPFSVIQGVSANSCAYLSGPANVTVGSNCNNPPVAVCQNLTVNANGNCQGTATAIDFNGGSSDPNNDPLTYSVSPAGPYGVGTTTVVLTVSDGVLSSTCTATILVRDVTPPAIVCPSNTVTANDIGSCGAAVTFSTAASDNCPGVTVVQTAGLPSGSLFPIGSTLNAFVATDGAGNSASCSFQVMVADHEDPSVHCPSVISVSNDPGQCAATVNYAVTGADNCPGVSVSLNPVSGSTFPVGNSTVTATATDAHGNTAACTFTVVVSDVEGPSIQCPANLRVSCVADIPAANTGLVITNDNCGAVAVAVNEVSVGTGCAGSPMVVTRTYTAEDQYRNATSCTQILTAEATPVVATCSNNAYVIPAWQDSACTTISVTAAGGCGPYRYLWCNGSQASSQSVCPTTSTSYCVTVTDVQGCSAVCCVTVCVVDIACSGGDNNGQNGHGQGGNGTNQNFNAMPHIAICHFPPGNSGNAMTKCLPIPAATQHFTIGHGGDYLGACGSLPSRHCVVSRSCDANRMAETKDAIQAGGEFITVKAFPSPTTGALNVEVACRNCADEGSYMLKVTDIYGKQYLMTEVNVAMGEGKAKIDLSRFAAGVYLIVVENGDQRIVERVVKQ